MFCLSFLLFLLSRDKAQANRTPHPPRTCCCFSFFLSPPLCFVRLFWPCVLFVLVFLRGAILGPVRFLDSLGTALMPFFGREAVEAFVPFLVCCFSRFAAHTFLVGLAPGLRKAGPRVVSPAPLARVRARGRMPFSGGGTQTPSCLFYFVLLVSVLGHRGPRALSFFCWGASFGAPRLTHALFSPGSFFFFPFLLSLSLSLSLLSACHNTGMCASVRRRRVTSIYIYIYIHPGSA